MRPVGFEPTISAGERPQTYALDRAATGTGTILKYQFFFTSLAVMNLCAVVGSVVFKNIKQLRITEQECIRP